MGHRQHVRRARRSGADVPARLAMAVPEHCRTAVHWVANQAALDGRVGKWVFVVEYTYRKLLVLRVHRERNLMDGNGLIKIGRICVRLVPMCNVMPATLCLCSHFVGRICASHASGVTQKGTNYCMGRYHYIIYHTHVFHVGCAHVIDGVGLTVW